MPKSWETKRSPCWTSSVPGDHPGDQPGHPVAGRDEDPSHTSSMAHGHMSRGDHGLCPRADTSFTQKTHANNHNQPLFPLLPALKRQEILLQEEFPAPNATGSDPSSLPEPRNFPHLLVLTESFSATRSTTGFGRRESKPGLASTSISSPQALTFFVRQERGPRPPRSYICQVGDLPRFWSPQTSGFVQGRKSGSGRGNCTGLAQTRRFPELSSPAAQRTLQHHPESLTCRSGR